MTSIPRDTWTNLNDNGQDASPRVLCPTLVIGLGAFGRKVVTALRKVLLLYDANVAETTSLLCIDSGDPPTEHPNVVERVRKLLIGPEDHVRVDLPGGESPDFTTRTQAFEALDSCAEDLIDKVSREIQRITTKSNLEDLRRNGYQIAPKTLELYLVGCIAEPLASAAAAHVPYVVGHLAELYAPDRSLTRVAVLALSNPDAKDIVQKDYDQAMSWAALGEIHARMQASPIAYRRTWSNQDISRTESPYHACYLVDQFDSEGQRLNSSDEMAELVTQLLALSCDQAFRADANSRSFLFGPGTDGMLNHGRQAACFRVFGLSTIRVPNSGQHTWVAIEQGLDIVGSGLRGPPEVAANDCSEAVSSSEGKEPELHDSPSRLDDESSVESEVSELERKLGITPADLDTLLMCDWTSMRQRLDENLLAVFRQCDEELDGCMIDTVAKYSRELVALSASLKTPLDTLYGACINSDPKKFSLTTWWQELVASQPAGIRHVRQILDRLIVRQQAYCHAGPDTDATVCQVSDEQQGPEETDHALDDADRKSLNRIGQRREAAMGEILELPSRSRLFWGAVALGFVDCSIPWVLAWQALLWWVWCLPLTLGVVAGVYLVWRFCVRERDRRRESALGTWSTGVVRRCETVWESRRAEACRAFRDRIAVTCTNILDGKIAPIDSKLAEIETILTESLSHRLVESGGSIEMLDYTEDESNAATRPVLHPLATRVELMLADTGLLQDTDEMVPLQGAQSLVAYLGETSGPPEVDIDLATLALNPEKFDAETKLSYLIIRARNTFAGCRRVAPHLGKEITWLCTPGDGRLADAVTDHAGFIRARLADPQKAVGLHVVSDLIPDSLVSAKRMRERWANLCGRDSAGLRGGFDEVAEIPEVSPELVAEADDEEWIQ